LDEFLHHAAELSQINVSGIADRDAVSACCVRAWQTGHDFSLQIQKHTASPDVLVLGQEESRDSFYCRPLSQELPVGIEHFYTPVFAIGDINLPLRVDHDVMRQLELAGAGPSAAELENVLSVMRELHDARAGV